MKRTLVTLCTLFTLPVIAQEAIPEVFNRPLTGFNRIREENHYMLMDRATDATGSNWERDTRITRLKSTLLNRIIEDRTSAWETNDWKDQFLQKDSIITEADQTTIKIDYSYTSYNYGTFSFEQKTKYQYTNDAAKRPVQIFVQSANPPASDNYQNYYKLTIQYDAAGLRTKDSYQYYNPASTSSKNYTYNDQKQVTATFSFNQVGDSSGKGFYTYTPDYRILNFIQFSFDEDLGDWMPTSADSLEYNAQGQISKYTRYLMLSTNGQNPEFGPYSIEEYQYTATGKLSEILTRNRSNDEWILTSNLVFTYVNEKPTVGNYYRSDDGTTLNPNPTYRYTFAPPTGTTETNALLTNASVYPNPVNDLLYIDLGKDSGTATLFDNKGSSIAQQPVNGKTSINTSALTPGIYLLRLQCGDEQTTRKILINH
ncbi:MAG: T9SS type A sorting domain-containing protein [Bacteroidota bacterium]